MNRKLGWALGTCAAVVSLQAAAQITFYEGQSFRGRTFAANQAVANFQNVGFNDRASSVVVDKGRWQVCEDARYEGRCVILRKGSYDSLQNMGLGDRISSVRPVTGNGRQYTQYTEVAPPLAAPNYDYRRRPSERIYEAPVTNVRAVLGQANQRCWVEREEVRGDPNVPGAVIGAILGGVLGHQVGSGRGNDVATVGGAIAGGAVGSQVGRGSSGRDVQRCEQVASGPPAYYDVTYNFRNTEHHAQMSTPPGRTISVNERGEPRG
jgi:uncharacterized protein YcfJ